MKIRLNLKPESAGILFVIVVFFIVFFWPTTLKGHFFIIGDAVNYSYPLRTVAFDMILRGSPPLWTPGVLAGFPLLSMVSLGLGYPLTWGYLFLPGYVAEQVYIIAPFLLSPIFVYAFLRSAGRSRIASLLAGLSFAYGGMMAGGLSHNGYFSNTVMWLPLLLIAIEGSRSRPLLPCLIGAAAAYAMSVLAGLGQGFVYAGVIALLYAAFLCVAPVDNDDRAARGWRRLAEWRNWKPMIVCAGGMALAAGVAAFQIFETMSAQRLSVRRELSYAVFSGGSLTAEQALRSFVAPLYHYNFEVSNYVAAMAAVAAIAAVVAAILAPRANLRVFFWLGLAVLAFLLLLGDRTPLYRLAYHVPFINLFRIPWRHAFEWTFAIAILSAYGWDAAATFFSGRIKTIQSAPHRIIGGALIAACVVAGFAMAKFAVKPGAEQAGPLESLWLYWKAAYTLLLLITVWWGWRKLNGHWRGALLALTVAIACFWEQSLMLSRWWANGATPSEYYDQVSPPSRFLQNYPPEQNRIYTSPAEGFILNLPRAEPYNISARRGLHDAAGYEPLMSERYNRAFGGAWPFSPAISSPPDKQMIEPNWQLFDLFNVRFAVEFATPPVNWEEKDGARFAVTDVRFNLAPGSSVVLTGVSAKVDTLSLVTMMTDSTRTPQDAIVADVIIHTTDGRRIEHRMKAGVDTADALHERPDIKSAIRHSLARVHANSPGDASNSFQALRYWTKFDLGEKTGLDRVEVKCLAEGAPLTVWKATIYDSSGVGAFPLTRRLSEHWRKVYDDDAAQIYENLRALPRAWLVPKVEVVSAEEARRRIRGESEQAFNPREVALFELTPDSSPDVPADNRNKIRLDLTEGNFKAPAEARILYYEPNRLAIETVADKRAALVVSETHYPGWEASIDGRPAPILTANYLLRGMIVPEGKHRVEMRYTAPAARRGAIISVSTLLALLGGVIFSIRASVLRIFAKRWK
ncbi:MAG TPA: YfhO family protein [Blastocatellia bacterium]|nr:YfhO family protein [Blastocatellia bacterium]